MLVLNAAIHKNPIYKKEQLNIIFDLGGVLIYTSKFNAFGKIGLGTTLSFMIHNGKPSEKTLFDALEMIGGKQIKKPFSCSPSGRPLPLLMCKWLTGAMTNKQIINKCLHGIQNNQTWFANKEHKKLVIKLILMTFSPKSFIDTQKTIVKHIKLAKKLKAKGHRIYILSNWDTESFTYLKEKYHKFFDQQVDGIVISGNVGCMKPDKKIYEILLNKFKLNPHNCVFVDDRIENILSAKECGIHIVHMQNNTKLKLALNNQLQEHATNITL
jgi:HAD superfamily hydrolase (TIGR01509 family)